MALIWGMFSGQSKHPLEESNGNGLLKLQIIPQSIFRVLLSPQSTLYTKGLSELLLPQQKPPSDRDRSWNRVAAASLIRCFMALHGPSGMRWDLLQLVRIAKWRIQLHPSPLPPPRCKFCGAGEENLGVCLIFSCLRLVVEERQVSEDKTCKESHVSCGWDESAGGGEGWWAGAPQQCHPARVNCAGPDRSSK